MTLCEVTNARMRLCTPGSLQGVQGWRACSHAQPGCPTRGALPAAARQLHLLLGCGAWVAQRSARTARKPTAAASLEAKNPVKGQRTGGRGTQAAEGAERTVATAGRRAKEPTPQTTESAPPPPPPPLPPPPPPPPLPEHATQGELLLPLAFHLAATRTLKRSEQNRRWALSSMVTAALAGRHGGSGGESSKRCTCKKTRCLKMYCECFASGADCGDNCSCQDCGNQVCRRPSSSLWRPLTFAHARTSWRWYWHWHWSRRVASSVFGV